MVPSARKVSTYDQKPEMSAYGIADEVVRADRRATCTTWSSSTSPTATWSATPACSTAAVKAVEHVDVCVGRILEAVQRQGGVAIVTADHGNCEQMIDPATGGPHTAHTTYDVELIVVDDRFKGKRLR